MIESPGEQGRCLNDRTVRDRVSEAFTEPYPADRARLGRSLALARTPMADEKPPESPAIPQQTAATSDASATISEGRLTDKKDEPPPLRSVHTSNFPAILQELGISLLVSTYQAGKLVVLRADGDKLNTHFRGFNKPMGLAVAGDRLAIGTAVEIWEYHNAPAVARPLEPAGQHDACFLPRSSVCTGDIQIHEMAWGSGVRSQKSGVRDQSVPHDELWFVNTRFSCLCTRSNVYSFVPRWRPPFVTALAPEDRCHLNGLCVIDGRPVFVTALGETDTPGGWRANKKDGGLLMEVGSGRILLGGLSMPHSPRWYDGKLWLLESGNGGIGYVEPSVVSGQSSVTTDNSQLTTDHYREVARLPGFTRGWTSVAPWRSSGCRRCARARCSAPLPLPSGRWPNAAAESGW
jgi:uncharacterized protein (TIGR03032 family)